MEDEKIKEILAYVVNRIRIGDRHPAIALLQEVTLELIELRMHCALFRQQIDNAIKQGDGLNRP